MRVLGVVAMVLFAACESGGSETVVPKPQLDATVVAPDAAATPDAAVDAAIDAPPPPDAAPEADACAGCCPGTPGVVSSEAAPTLPGVTASFDVAVTSRDSAGCAPRVFEVHPRGATQGLTVVPAFGLGLPTPALRGGETAHVTITATPSLIVEGVRARVSFDVLAPPKVEPLFEGELELPVAERAGCHVAIPREEMITSVSVVDDPVRTAAGGAWTFRHLVEALAPSPAQAPAIVAALLATLASPQEINGFTVAARPGVRAELLDMWPRDAGGALDLDAAPLQLLAIVNRFDLRDLAAGDAGELRFVFGFTQGPLPLEATIIFEYRLPAASEADVRAWADDFHALGAQPFSEAYNVALQALTERVVAQRGTLSAVRTNEIAFGVDWELRQFAPSPATGMLVPVPLDLTPDVSFLGTPLLASFINDNAPAIIAETHTVPERLAGAPFLAGATLNVDDTWNAPGILDNEARHHFALNTCNGCHSGESDTGFVHVRPRFAGHPSFLSGFLVGDTVADPVTRAPRRFDDLARRAADLAAVVCPPSPAASLRRGLRRVH